MFMNIVDRNIPGIPLSFINALERIFTTNPQSLVQFIVDLFTHKKDLFTVKRLCNENKCCVKSIE